MTMHCIPPVVASQKELMDDCLNAIIIEVELRVVALGELAVGASPSVVAVLRSTGHNTAEHSVWGKSHAQRWEQE